MKRLSQGFTLIEILIVLLILGILFAVIIVNVRGEVVSNQIRSATSQIAVDIERVRNSSIKMSKDSSFTLSADGFSYVMKIDGIDGPSVPIPDGVKMSAFDSSTVPVSIKVIGYTAPYGDASAAGSTLTLSKDGGSDRTLYLVGVTGKVIRK